MDPAAAIPAESCEGVARILRDAIGLDCATLGRGSLPCAIAKRMHASGTESAGEYVRRLANSPEELDALVALVVVPETWFFRDREPFVFLSGFIRSEWKARRTPRPMRILSAPCATGEEPYSIAMACLESGLAAAEFSVDAVDINGAFLERARRATYGRNSFRGADPAAFARYFRFIDGCYTVREEVRRQVRFLRANIAAPTAIPLRGPYDTVFCRNLMIYLHDEARARVLTALGQLLAPDGILFIGHAEINPLVLESYCPVNHKGAFALRRKQPEGAAPRARAECFIAPATPPQASPLAPAANEAEELIEEANAQADRGRLDEAERLCRAALARDASCARAHFIMGLIGEARGDNARAEESFRRALYLEGHFTDAIIHLAALKEQEGDRAAAELLRRRARAAGEAVR